MELELLFDGLIEDVVDAVLDVRLDDLAMADGQAGGATAVVANLTVPAASPKLRLAVDLPLSGDAYEPGLLVRLRGRTSGDEPMEFFNTTATPVPAGPGEPVRVRLSRIA